MLNNVDFSVESHRVSVSPPSLKWLTPPTHPALPSLPSDNPCDNQSAAKPQTLPTHSKLIKPELPGIPGPTHSHQREEAIYVTFAPSNTLIEG